MSNRWEMSELPPQLFLCIGGQWKMHLMQRKLRLSAIPTVRYAFPRTLPVLRLCDELEVALDDVEETKRRLGMNHVLFHNSSEFLSLPGDSREATGYVLSVEDLVPATVCYSLDELTRRVVAGAYPGEEAPGITNIVRQMTCNHIRDVFGPYHWRRDFSPKWRTETVVALTRGIVFDKAFDRMPILADALEDADCDDEEVLKHCRGDTSHVLGCWVLDAITGKHPPLSWRA